MLYVPHVFQDAVFQLTFYTLDKEFLHGFLQSELPFLPLGLVHCNVHIKKCFFCNAFHAAQSLMQRSVVDWKKNVKISLQCFHSQEILQNTLASWMMVLGIYTHVISQKSEVNWPTCLSKFACIKNLHTSTESDQKSQEPNILIPKCTWWHEVLLKKRRKMRGS